MSLKVSAILPGDAGLVAGQPHREIARLHRLKRLEQFLHGRIDGRGGLNGLGGRILPALPFGALSGTPLALSGTAWKSCLTTFLPAHRLQGDEKYQLE